MAIIATDSGSKTYKLPEQGTHVARCTRVIDLGTQYSEMFKHESRKISLSFELDEDIEIEKDGETKVLPMMLSVEYSLSLHEKSNLRGMLEAWRGRSFTEEELKGFDVANVLGKPCLVSVVHKVGKDGKTRAKIEQVSNVVKGMTCRDAVTQEFSYEVTDGKTGTWELIPEWIQNKIIASREFQKASTESETDNSVMVDYSQIPIEDCPF